MDDISNPEYESMKGYEHLPLPKFDFASKPCDICGKVTGETRFWGATSVLVCPSPKCSEEVGEQWMEIYNENKKDDETMEEYYDLEEYYD
jgi:hypothetical protein